MVRDLYLNDKKHIYKATPHWTWLTSEYLTEGCGDGGPQGF